jgi:hypothetical protein
MREKEIRRKIRKGDVSGRKKTSNFMYALLFLSPCPVLIPFIQTAADGWKFQYIFPMVVYGLIFIGSAYSVVLKRNFITDIAPIALIPIGLVRRLLDIGRAGAGAASWSKRIATRDIKQDNLLERADFVPANLFDLVDHEKIMPRLNRGQHAVLGHNSRRVVTVDWLDARHLIFTGVTGYGKTTVALTVLASMLMVGPSILKKWRFKIHDAKRVVGWWFKPLAQALPDSFEVHMDFDNSFAALKELHAEMQTRNELVGKAGMEPEDAGLDRIIVFLDEVAEFYGHHEHGKEYQRMVQELVNQGRQAGIHMVLVTYYALAEVVSSRYRGNLRIATAHMKEETIRSHGIKNVHLLKRHEFLYEEDPGQDEVFFKTYRVGRDDILRLADQLIGDTMVQTNVDPVEVMIRIAASMPNVGYRTYQRVGLQQCQAMVASSQLEEVPFPWSQIEIREDEKGVEKPFPSKEADQWIRERVADLKELGILSEPEGQGKAPRFAQDNVTNAIAIWRQYNSR